MINGISRNGRKGSQRKRDVKKGIESLAKALSSQIEFQLFAIFASWREIMNPGSQRTVFRITRTQTAFLRVLRSRQTGSGISRNGRNGSQRLIGGFFGEWGLDCSLLTAKKP